MQNLKFIFAVLVLVIGLAVYSFVNSKNGAESFENYFSASSLLKINELNEQYKLVSVRDLRNLDEDVFEPTTLSADVLSIEESTNNLGIITKVNLGDDKDLLLSWQPESPLSKEKLKKIAEEFERQIPEIEVAEPDQNIEILNLYDLPGTEKESEGISSFIDEGSAVVALIDSGIYRYHRDFDTDRIYKRDGKTALEWNFATNSNNVSDVIGHGTHIAGIIHENSASRLMILDIFDPKNKSSKLSYLLAALDFAKKNGAKIVNLSLGVRQDSYLLEEAVRKLYEENIVIVAGTGNDGKNTGLYPAKYKEVISIAALNKKGDKSILSNYGNWVDYAVNGEDIYSFKNAKNGYKYMSGTSQAAAMATAWIAETIDQENPVNIKQLKKTLDAKVKAFSGLNEKYEGLMGKGVITLN